MLELNTRPSLGPIAAAKGRLTLLGQYWQFNRPRPSVEPVLAVYINLPIFRRCLAQQRHFIGPSVTFTKANHVLRGSAKVWPNDGKLLGQVSLLLRQTMLYEEKSGFGPGAAHYCSKLRLYYEKSCFNRTSSSLT